MMMVDITTLLQDYTKSTPVNVEAIGRSLGLEVNKKAILPHGISGHLMLLPNGKYEIAANADEHYYRQRFTLAHEIGHFVLHKDLVDSFGGVDDDTKYRSTERGDIYNSLIDSIHERQANSFAANLLMPKHLVHELVFDENGGSRSAKLSDLYKTFQVSASAMNWRLKNLGWDIHVNNDT